ncbi:ABC transporter permease, partial [Rhizobium ruizarguesonis]
MLLSPNYIAKRLVMIVYTLLVVSLIVFAITQILPADAAVMMLGENATQNALDALRQTMGLDQPVWQQYLTWIWHVLQGDLG